MASAHNFMANQYNKCYYWEYFLQITPSTCSSIIQILGQGGPNFKGFDQFFLYGDTVIQHHYGVHVTHAVIQRQECL